METKNFFATDAQGNIMPAALCYVYYAGTTNLATGLRDISGNVLTNPFTSMQNGLLQFQAPNDVYDVRVLKGTRDYTLRGIQCADLVDVLETTSSLLGPFAVAPTTRNDGTALVLGDRYFNTSDDTEYLYKSTGWEANNLDGQRLSESDGSSLIGFIQSGTGAVARDAQSKMRERVTPADFQAVGDGVTDDTAKFTALQAAFSNRIVDLLGKTYVVASRPVGNRYINGFFKVGNYRLRSAVENPADFLYGYNSRLGWEVWPSIWEIQTYSASSGATSRNTAPTRSFGSMVASPAAETRAFPYDYHPVNGPQLIQGTVSYSGSGTMDGTSGFVIESFDLDGVYSEVKIPFDYVSSQWKRAAMQYRLPTRTREYRAGLYRDASSATGTVYFARFIADVALDTNAVTGGGQETTAINIKRAQASPSRLSDIVRIGPSPTTALQDFVQVKGTDTLFFGSGHEVVVGSGIDALVVERGTRGANVITTTEYQSPLEVCTGHAGLSLQYLDDNSYRMWSGGSSAGTAVRFKYNGSPTGGTASNVEIFQLFDTTYAESTFPTVSFDGRWLVAVGRTNVDNQIVRVWKLSDLATAGDYRQSYVYEWAIPHDIIGSSFPMQGVTCDGSTVFLVTGGFQPGTPGSIKMGHFTLAGDTISIIMDVTVGAADYAANGSAWEPQGLEIYQAGPNSEPLLSMIVITGSGSTKKHTVWVLGGAGTTLLEDTTVTVKKSGNLAGFTHFRDNSPSNAMNACQTQAGTVYYGNSNGSEFAVGAAASASGSWLRAQAAFIAPGVDNAASFGSPALRATQVYAVNGAINTSDENEKTEIEPFSDKLLNAIANIEFKQFKWKESLAVKGDAARIHSGVIAQQVRDAFLSAGIDPFERGVLCFDEWPNSFDEDGTLLVAAGERYSVRYEELLILMSALAQRTERRMLDVQADFEKRLAVLEGKK